MKGIIVGFCRFFVVIGAPLDWHVGRLHLVRPVPGCRAHVCDILTLERFSAQSIGLGFQLWRLLNLAVWLELHWPTGRLEDLDDAAGIGDPTEALFVEVPTP